MVFEESNADGSNSDSGEELEIPEGSNGGSDNEEKDEDVENILKGEPKKIFKRGIVYLSFIPHGLSPVLMRNLLTKHAPVGRIHLQAVKQKGEYKKKKYKTDNFSEGWVEFLKKRHAKSVAELLNNTQIGGKKKSQFHDYLWNLKYLPRFKWVHIVERLNYERAVYNQRLRNEISQAKKVANHFKETVDKEEKIRKKKKRKESISVDLGENKTKPTPRQFTQREMQEEKKTKKKSHEKREDFLKNLFA